MWTQVLMLEKPSELPTQLQVEALFFFIPGVIISFGSLLEPVLEPMDKEK